MIAVGSYLNSNGTGTRTRLPTWATQESCPLLLAFGYGLRGLSAFAIESNYETFGAVFAKYSSQNLRIVFQENIFPVHFNNAQLFIYVPQAKLLLAFIKN